VSLIQIAILALVQGAAELLPVSSSAHVIVAAKLMGLDPTSPEMTLLLVMLHTGTMFAVIVYFWNSWRRNYFSSRRESGNFAGLLLVATACTGAIGLVLKSFIEKIIFRHLPNPEVELLFGNLALISASLAAVGFFIIYAGVRGGRSGGVTSIGLRSSSWIGAVQGLCLPLRGFSRSGATISAGLVLGLNQERVEEFSFALAVLLTPAVIGREALRLLHARGVSLFQGAGTVPLFYSGLLGMVFSFVSGLLALKLLSHWLARGRWQLFGFYCLGAAVIVFWLYGLGF